jgi:hypothetical protein
MNRLTRAVRKFARDWTHGLLAARDVLYWGQAYPRSVDLRTLKRMRNQ